jgi:hypothetical protein
VAKIANAALTLKRGNAVVVQAEVTPIDHRCPAEWLAGRTSHFVHRKNMHDAFFNYPKIFISLNPLMTVIRDFFPETHTGIGFSFHSCYKTSRL